MNAASIVVVGIVVALAALAVVRNAKRKGSCACGCGGSCGGDCAERHAGHDHAAASDEGGVEAKNAN